VKAHAELRAEVEKVTLEEMARVGPDQFSQDVVVSRFLDRGPSRSTLFRWVGDVLKSGKPGQHLARKVKAAAAERAARSPDPAADAAREMRESLPAPVSVDAMAGSPAIRVIEELQAAIIDINKVRAYAKNESGGVRNAGLILKSAEALRRAVETAARLAQQMHELAQVERFHDAIIQEVAKESPAAAERILAAVGRLAETYAPSAP
jgi:hypothetical protein